MHVHICTGTPMYTVHTYMNVSLHTGTVNVVKVNWVSPIAHSSTAPQLNWGCDDLVMSHV